MYCRRDGSEEGYYYWTIGGNHSRQALQELLKEKPTLAKNKQYSHRLCAIYKPMETKLIRWLASKHNRAAAYCHEINTWDWMSIKYAYTYVHWLYLLIKRTNWWNISFGGKIFVLGGSISCDATVQYLNFWLVTPFWTKMTTASLFYHQRWKQILNINP